MGARSTTTASSAYVWDVPGKPCSVRLSLHVVDRLGVLAAGSLHTPGGTSEIGGLLLGTVEPGATAIASVEDFLPLPCEHFRGPAFALSGKDRKALAATLRHRRWDARLAPVGFWRTHSRPGLFLDQHDFALIRDYFGAPSQVALLIGREAGELTAGFFIWEDGDIHRQSPYVRFPFDRALLAPGTQPSDRHAAEPAPTRSVPPEPVVASVPASAPSRTAPWMSGYRFPGASQVISWAAVALAVAVLALVPYAIGRRSRPVAASPARSSLSLYVVRAGDGLRLTWDRDSEAIRRASGATVHIAEGSRDLRLDLTPEQLALGSVVYFPSSADVGFRMELRGPSGPVHEFVRAVLPAEAPARLVLPGPPPQSAGLPSNVSSADRLALPPQEGRRARPSRRPAPRSLDYSAASPARGLQAALELPPDLPPASGTVSTPGLLAPRHSRLEATVTLEAAEPSGFTRVIRRIPGLRRLKASPGKSFVPPRPIRRVQPVIPPGPSHTPVAVDLKVRIDESGNVLRAEVLSGDPDEFAARQAVGAARKWQFAPAEVDGKPVASDMVLHFRFGG